MQRFKGTRNDSTQAESKLLDIEISFPGLRYKSISGLDAYGKPRVYSENMPESAKGSVYIPSDKSLREQTDIELTLYFFDPDYIDGHTDEEQLMAVEEVYHKFVDFVSGGSIVYYDTARKRKVKMYLNDAVTIGTDRLTGVIYKEVTFKFKNLYGQSFPTDDTTFIPIVKL